MTAGHIPKSTGPFSSGSELRVQPSATLVINPWRLDLSYAMTYEWIAQRIHDDHWDPSRIRWIDMSFLDKPYSGRKWRWRSSLALRRNPAPRLFAQALQALGVQVIRPQNLKGGSPWADEVSAFLYKSELAGTTGAKSEGKLTRDGILAGDIARSVQVLERVVPALASGINLMVTVNGRTRVPACFLAEARLRGIDFVTLEMGIHPHLWMEFINSTPHDRPDTRMRVSATASTAVTPSGRVSASDFLDARLRGESLQGYRFQPDRDDAEGVTTKIRQDGRRLVTFFPTSEREFGILAYERPTEGLWTQADAYVELERACADLNFDLIVRVHPQPWGSDAALDEDSLWQDRINGRHVTLIRASDPVNSYSLARLSDVCVTYESSIGPEIAWMGRPLVVTGDPVWRDSFAGCLVRDGQSLRSLLTNPPEVDRDMALPWGFYMANSGSEYRALRVDGPGSVILNRLLVDQARLNPAGTILARLRQFRSRVFKR